MVLRKFSETTEPKRSTHAKGVYELRGVDWELPRPYITDVAVTATAVHDAAASGALGKRSIFTKTETTREHSVLPTKLSEVR